MSHMPIGPGYAAEASHRALPARTSDSAGSLNALRICFTVSAGCVSAMNVLPISTRHSSRLPAYSSAGDIYLQVLFGALMNVAKDGYVLGYVEISNCHNLGYMPVLA